MHFLMYLLAVALQAPDSGAFVITLGKDTIGMERYTRTADRLVDDMVMRDRAPVISRHFVATLGADGLISHIELDNKPVVASAVFRVDAAGHILGADGRLTTQKVVVTRVPTLDLDAFAAAFGNRPLGQLSPPDSVRVDVAGAHIAVDYGRPAMRGRKIFGDIVPWKDRKSTRLNSSHGYISYAVFCLKKKKPQASRCSHSMRRPLTMPRP